MRGMDADRLKSRPVSAGLDPAAAGAVARLAAEVSVPAGREFVREGDCSPYEMLAIGEGTAEVTRGGRHVAELGPGDVGGEVGVVEKRTRDATVTATRRCSW